MLFACKKSKFNFNKINVWKSFRALFFWLLQSQRKVMQKLQLFYCWVVFRWQTSSKNNFTSVTCLQFLSFKQSRPIKGMRKSFVVSIHCLEERESCLTLSNFSCKFFSICYGWFNCYYSNFKSFNFRKMPAFQCSIRLNCSPATTSLKIWGLIALIICSTNKANALANGEGKLCVVFLNLNCQKIRTTSEAHL